MKLEKLCQPATIGSLRLRNRMVMAPMGASLCRDGCAGERIKKYFEARAKGGVGLIITGLAAIDRDYAVPDDLAVWDDKFIPGLHQLVRAVHVHGAKIFIMLWHPGRQWDVDPLPVAPSPVPCRSFLYGDRRTPRELTTGEVDELVEKFAEGARRIRDAGADGVELHGTHGYLIHQFFSPYTNVRTDRYGGSIDNRARFAVEIVHRIKEKCGVDFPIDIRMGLDHLVPGNGPDELRQIARIMEGAGVASIGASGGHNETGQDRFYGVSTATMGIAPGWTLDDARAIKAAVDIPVFAVGGLGVDLDFAESILVKGEADFIQMGRALIADPELPNKVMSGRREEVNWCIRCGECFPHDRDRLRKPDIHCSVNAFMGREADPAWKITRAVKPRKVYVAGGGPGGMEAARVAALRGHEVTLFEREGTLGGALILASVPPEKGEVAKKIGYLSHELERLGVKVVLGKELTPRMIETGRPDAVVLATGASPSIPDIPGVTGRNVFTVREILAGTGQSGDRVAVLGGGGMGSEAADYLADQGKKVTVIEIMPEEELGRMTGRGKPNRLQREVLPGLWGLARDLPRRYRLLLLKRLKEKGVRTLIGVETVEITEKGVSVKTAAGMGIIEADTVVIAAGEKANDALYRELYGKVPEVYMVGDCLGHGKLMDAIEDGAYVGLQV